MNHWQALGLKRTDDVSEIRRAYARKLKATDVEADPAAFVALRAAFERATADAQGILQRKAQKAEAGESAGPDDTMIAMQAVEPALAMHDEGGAPPVGLDPDMYQPNLAEIGPEAGEDPNAR